MTLNKQTNKKAAEDKKKQTVHFSSQEDNKLKSISVFSQSKTSQFSKRGRRKTIPSKRQLSAVLRPLDFLFHYCCSCNNTRQHGTQGMSHLQPPLPTPAGLSKTLPKVSATRYSEQPNLELTLFSKMQPLVCVYFKLNNRYDLSSSLLIYHHIRSFNIDHMYFKAPMMVQKFR